MNQYAAIRGLDCLVRMMQTDEAGICETSGLYYWKDVALGFEMIKPDGAFYVLLKSAAYNQDSFAFLQVLRVKKRLLSFLGLLLANIASYVRLSYAASIGYRGSYRNAKEYVEEHAVSETGIAI